MSNRAPHSDYFDTPPPPMPLHGDVLDAFHASLPRTTRWQYLEPYVEALCRYCTAEKKADRMHWNYELPSDQKLLTGFKQLHGKSPLRE